VTHYGKIAKMCQFYSDSSRFFATNCTIRIDHPCSNLERMST
jgi:hypothetical protein